MTPFEVTIQTPVSKTVRPVVLTESGHYAQVLPDGTLRPLWVAAKMSQADKAQILALDSECQATNNFTSLFTPAFYPFMLHRSDNPPGYRVIPTGSINPPVFVAVAHFTRTMRLSIRADFRSGTTYYKVLSQLDASTLAQLKRDKLFWYHEEAEGEEGNWRGWCSTASEAQIEARLSELGWNVDFISAF
ncbi:MAG: hypothetical protein INR73_28620 [Williamsia sp.]|nr:hypothetical protein [Williamsia sp.]